jgi:hypothetical protein
MIEEIARQVQEAARVNKKVAMFHYQVLINASELEGVDPAQFCRDIGVRPPFATEFRKMMNLAKLINEMGLTITRRF